MGTEKELSVTLPEFREGEMMLKCEVKAKREIAGRINLITKSGETELNVADAHSHQLMLKKGRPNASLQDMDNIYGARVNQESVQISGNRQYGRGVALVGYIDRVSDSLFNNGNHLLVECKAWYGDQMFKKKDLALSKDLPRNPRNGQGGNWGSHG